MTRVRVIAVGLMLLAAGCRDRAPAPDVEPPTLSVTNWTGKTELFMEHPPLVAGEPARFAVHLTRLSDFSAMTAGRPRLELLPERGGASVVIQGLEPSRPGVFRIEGPMPAAGAYRWALIVDAPGLADRHELGRVTVYADAAAGLAAATAEPPDDPAAIAYLKESQWTTPFAATAVAEGDVRSLLRLSATIGPLTGGDAVVGAPVDGRFTARPLLSIGDRVTEGQELGRLQPRLADDGRDRATLEAAVSEAAAAVEGARAELNRAERLLAERAVPARRAEEARRAATIADARLRAAQARLQQRDDTLRGGGAAADSTAGNAFVVRAPIAGRVAEVQAVAGASYDEGAPLFRVVRTDRVELQVLVPAADAPLPGPIDSIALEIAGRSAPLVVDADHMHDAGVLDQATRSLPVQFDVDNRAGHLLIGQSLTALIYTGGRQRMLTVPASAVLYDAGRPFVFVQVDGESFSRRLIDIAVRDGDVVGIRAGVRVGERVVTRGAYEIQLASAAGGIPAEGHVH